MNTLSSWAKFFFGIPIAILIITLALFGCEKLSDSNKLVDQAKQDIQPALQRVKTERDDLKKTTEDQSLVLNNSYADERSRSQNLSHNLEPTSCKPEADAAGYDAAIQEIEKVPKKVTMVRQNVTQVQTTLDEASAGCTYEPMTLSCTLPFDQIKQSRPIDNCCGDTGSSKPGTPQAIQNQVKNNFCAAGSPIDISLASLQYLQQAVTDKKVPFGTDAQLPEDRSVLRSLGEGTIVRLAAFVQDAYYSNTARGESVNCMQYGTESNDIAIVLAAKNDQADECQSARAEMSPHFRPPAWTPQNINQNSGHLFRFTGQLFFDASHLPCSGDRRPNPRRSTLWEIHPVYAVDICTAASNHCNVGSDMGWVPISDYVGTDTGRQPRQFIQDDLVPAGITVSSR